MILVGTLQIYRWINHNCMLITRQNNKYLHYQQQKGRRARASTWLWSQLTRVCVCTLYEQVFHTNTWTLWLGPISDTRSRMQSRTRSHFHATQTYHVVWGELQNTGSMLDIPSLISSPKPLPLTAVFTTAVCLFQKHNIAIICQPIPAWTACIVNSLQHALTRAQSSSLFERRMNTAQNKPAHLSTDAAISALCPR